MTRTGMPDPNRATRAVRPARKSGAWRGLVIVATAAMIAAACGGGSKKANTSATTASTLEETTTSAPGETSTSAPGETTTSAAPSATTATTAKKTTTTTAKKNAVVANPNNSLTKKPTVGGNVAATSSTAPPVNVQIGGSITWLKAGEIPSLDPAGAMANSGASDGPAGFAIYDMLFYTDGGVVKSHTADSLTSSDAVNWTLKIHPGIKFSDGTDYNADAIVYNWQRIADPANGATRKSIVDSMASYKAVDPTTVAITLKVKNALFPGNLALMPFIGCPAAEKQYGTDFTNHPCGAGPFTMQSWTRDSNMVVVRNPNYWDKPRPYVDKITFRPITDETQRINTFCAGQADLTYVGAVSNAAQVNSQKCGTINPLVLNGGTDLFFNLTKPPMNNANLRKAISMAMDPDDYSKVVTGGLINSTKSMFRPDSPFYDPSIIQGPFNKAQAQALFTQASQELKQDPINIDMTTFPVLNYQQTATYVQSKLNEYQHVKVNFITEASAAHITNCQNKSYTGICVFGTIFDDPDPTFTGVFQCNSVPNYTGYCNSQFDSLVADNEQTLDPNKRIQDWKDIQKTLYADPPVVFMEQRSSWVFSAPGIQDFHFVNDGLPLLDRFWLKTH